MKTQLTIAEALAEGFTKVGTDTTGWQHLHELSDMTAADFDGRTKYFLFTKEAQYCMRETKDFADMVADRISDDYADETGSDDVKDIFEEIKALDFSSITQKINFVMSSYPYWTKTSIELIP
jgi:hypothetical protein